MIFLPKLFMAEYKNYNNCSVNVISSEDIAEIEKSRVLNAKSLHFTSVLVEMTQNRAFQLNSYKFGF